MVPFTWHDQNRFACLGKRQAPGTRKGQPHGPAAVRAGHPDQTLRNRSFPNMPIFSSFTKSWLLPLVLVLAGCHSAPKGADGGGGQAPPAPVTETLTGPMELTGDVLAELDPHGRFLLGIEVEQDLGYPHLRNRRVALVTDPLAIDQQGVHVVERLASSLLFTLTDVLVIDDGVTTGSMALERGLEVAEQIPAPPRIHRLDRENWRPGPEMFRTVDVVVWDAPLRGPRMTVDQAVLGALLEKTALNGTTLVVLDRPSIMGRRQPDGPPADPALTGTRTAISPVPPYPAMTAGELALYHRHYLGLEGRLHVQPMRHWNRGDGQGWLESDLPHLVSGAREPMRREVRNGPIFAPNVVELLAVLELAGADAWPIRELRLGEGNSPELLLLPADLAPVTVMERLTGLGPLGVTFAMTTEVIDGVEESLLVIRPEEGRQVGFLDLAMALRFASNSGNRGGEGEEEPDLFGSSFISQGLERGLTPDRVRRRWLNTPAYRTFLSAREEVLLYQP